MYGAKARKIQRLPRNARASQPSLVQAMVNRAPTRCVHFRGDLKFINVVMRVKGEALDGPRKSSTTARFRARRQAGRRRSRPGDLRVGPPNATRLPRGESPCGRCRTYQVPGRDPPDRRSRLPRRLDRWGVCRPAFACGKIMSESPRGSKSSTVNQEHGWLPLKRKGRETHRWCRVATSLHRPCPVLERVSVALLNNGSSGAGPRSRTPRNPNRIIAHMGRLPARRRTTGDRILFLCGPQSTRWRGCTRAAATPSGTGWSRENGAGVITITMASRPRPSGATRDAINILDTTGAP